MESHEPSRNRSRKEADSNMDSRGSRADDEEDWEGSDKRKHKSNKSRKHADSEEIEEHDSGRRKASGARNDARKKSGVSSRAGSGDENDYDSKRESHSKIPRKSVDDRVEKRSTDDYGDRDLEGSRKRRDDENDWDSSKKTSLRPSLNESSQNKPRSKSESAYEEDLDRSHDRESRFSDKKDINKEKRDQSQHDQERSSQHRRWDEVEFRRKSEDSSYKDRSDTKIGKVSDSNKHGSSRDRDQDCRSESGENKSKPGEASGEKGNRPSNRDDRREDGDRSRIHSSLATPDDDSLVNRAPREIRLDSVKDRPKMANEQSPDLVADSEQNAQRHSSKSQGDKDEKQREQRDFTRGSRDEFENSEKPVDEDSHSRMWDRSSGDGRRNKRSRSPERSGRNSREYDDHDRGFQDSDNERSERSNSNKGKDREKEDYQIDRSSTGKDTIWTDRIRDQDSSKEQWRRSQTRQDSNEGEEFDNLIECDVKRREHVRLGSENFHARSSYRKDARLRSDGGRVSSTFGNRNDSSDSIEIRPNKNLDFGREESTPFTGRKAEIGPQQELTSGGSDEEWGCPPHDRNRLTRGDDFQESYLDDGSLMEQSSDRNSLDSQVNKGKMQKMDASSNHASGFSNSNFQPSFGNNHGPGSYNRSHQQGPKGSRHVRGPRGRMTGRDAQRVGLPPPLIGPPFGHLGLPPGQLQPIGPSMNHSPVAPIGPGVFIPPFGGPLSWPGARAVDMNMLAAPPNFPPIPPPGHKGPRFPPAAAGSSHMYFNQPGAARGALPSTSSPGLSSLGPVSREMSHDKAPGGWVPPARNNGPAGKAPSRGEQNDYSQNFVDTGMRPQNFIRELELTNVVEDYPKLRELIQRKDEIVANSASPPMYYKCDLREFALSPEFFGTKFDVILVDPPWEEYVHRSPGITDHLEYWTFEEIMNLKIEAIADTPSFIFLWVGDGVGLEQGRQCLKKWGFRRCEDICWIKTNKKNAAPGLRHDSHTVLQHSKEHCLMGIKGTVRRSTDGHIIHANIDTDIIIAEEPSNGSTKKPEDMYRIIEHFALGRRRLELFGEDHNIRSGWLTLGKGLSSSNFNAETYERNFSDKDGKVWQGGGGRNPPPDAPHLVVTTPEIESLRPKSPPAKNQQQSTPLMVASSSNNNRRASGNSPQNPLLNMDPSDSEPAILPPWASSPMMGGFRGPDTGLPGSSDPAFDNYGFNAFAQTMGDHMDFDSHHPAVNML